MCININKLAKIPCPPKKIPTFEESTISCDIIIEFKNGEILEIQNDYGYIDNDNYKKKYINHKQYEKDTGVNLMNGDYLLVDEYFTKIVKKVFPEVKNVYLMDM